MCKDYAKALKMVEELLSSEIGRYFVAKQMDWYDWDEFDAEAQLVGFDEVRSGCTKIVLINYDWDFVVKINTDKKLNYCDIEAKNYKFAKTYYRTVADKLAWCERIGRVYGVPVYAQEYVDCDEDRICDEAYDDAGKYRDRFSCSSAFEDWFWDEDVCWDVSISELFESRYGSIRELEEWIENCGVNDLHCGNFGFRGDDPVIVDYSGYGVLNELKSSGYAIYK